MTVESPSPSDSGTFCCTVSDEMNHLVTDCSNVTVAPATSSPHNKHNSGTIAAGICGGIGILLLIIMVVIGSIVIYWWWRIRHRIQPGHQRKYIPTMCIIIMPYT